MNYYRSSLFQPAVKKKYFFYFWKLCKLTLSFVLIISFLYGCAQNFDSTVSSGSGIHLATKKPIIDVFFEIVLRIGKKPVHHYIYQQDNKYYTYYYNQITNWSEAWKNTHYSPFYGLFVFPIIWFLNSSIWFFNGRTLENDYSDGGLLISFSILFSIFLTTLLIKLLTLVFAFRSQQNQEKMQGLQLKINEIQNRYKYSSEPNARQKMQMEIMGLYRSENINPLSSFLSVMLTFPFLYAMFIVIRANRLLKESRVGKIELIEQPWNGMGNHWEYLILVVIYLVIQVVSTLLPIYLTWISDKKKDSNKKKAIRKQVLTQLIFFLLFLFIIFKAPSGLTFYWIFTGFLQILQILFFYFYNLKLKQKTKKEKKNIVYQF